MSNWKVELVLAGMVGVLWTRISELVLMAHTKAVTVLGVAVYITTATTTTTTTTRYWEPPLVWVRMVSLQETSFEWLVGAVLQPKCWDVGALSGKAVSFRPCSPIPLQSNFFCEQHKTGADMSAHLILR